MKSKLIGAMVLSLFSLSVWAADPCDTYKSNYKSDSVWGNSITGDNQFIASCSDIKNPQITGCVVVAKARPDTNGRSSFLVDLQLYAPDLHSMYSDGARFFDDESKNRISFGSLDAKLITKDGKPFEKPFETKSIMSLDLDSGSLTYSISNRTGDFLTPWTKQQSNTMKCTILKQPQIN